MQLVTNSQRILMNLQITATCRCEFRTDIGRTSVVQAIDESGLCGFLYGSVTPSTKALATREFAASQWQFWVLGVECCCRYNVGSELGAYNSVAFGLSVGFVQCELQSLLRSVVSSVTPCSGLSLDKIGQRLSRRLQDIRSFLPRCYFFLSLNTSHLSKFALSDDKNEVKCTGWSFSMCYSELRPSSKAVKGYDSRIQLEFFLRQCMPET